MGKHYVSVVIFSLTILFNLNAYAVTAKLTSARGHTSSAETPSKRPCDKTFESLKYVGLSFHGSAICVDANNDAQARKVCDQTPKKRIINPGNPQYGDGKAPVDPRNKRDENILGYYYCVDESNKKKEMCLSEAASEFMQYLFYWYDDNGASLDGDDTKDGNCWCNAKGEYGQNKLQLCDTEKPALAEKEKEKEKEKPSDKVLAKRSTEPDPELKKCVDTYFEHSTRCKKAAEDTGKSCGTGDKMSKEEKEKVAAIDAVNNALTAPKAGKGMQAECFTASLVATGAKTALTGAKESCDADINACASLCSEDESKKLRDACLAIKGSDADENGAPTPNSKYFSQYDAEANTIYENAQKFCTEDAKKSQFSLDSLLKNVGEALSSSVKCMCQTSASGDCNAIPTVANCDANPGSPGCGVYGSVAVCTPGSGYDAKLCSCQLNPKEAGCPGGGLSGGLSNFASPSIKSNGINDGAASTIAGGLKATDAFPDLPRGTDDSSSGGTPMTLGASPASGPGGGGGGGLGGGGASGGGEPPAAAGEPEAEEKGFGGLFNQAKTFFKDTLGRRKTPTAAMKNGKSEKGFDPNKLRPTRGIASKNGIGSKNQDIWKMSNSCMYAETCPRNMNSFLEAPLKQK